MLETLLKGVEGGTNFRERVIERAHSMLQEVVCVGSKRRKRLRRVSGGGGELWEREEDRVSRRLR